MACQCEMPRRGRWRAVSSDGLGEVCRQHGLPADGGARRVAAGRPQEPAESLTKAVLRYTASPIMHRGVPAAAAVRRPMLRHPHVEPCREHRPSWSCANEPPSARRCAEALQRAAAGTDAALRGAGLRLRTMVSPGARLRSRREHGADICCWAPPQRTSRTGSRRCDAAAGAPACAVSLLRRTTGRCGARGAALHAGVHAWTAVDCARRAGLRRTARPGRGAAGSARPRCAPNWQACARASTSASGSTAPRAC